MKIKNNDLCSYTDEALIKTYEQLKDFIEKDKTQAFIRKLHTLLDVERELTLRENL